MGSVDPATLLRATAYDADYWQARYTKSDQSFEWYTSTGTESPVQALLGAAPLQVLDLGCGTSRCAFDLAVLGHHVTGVDFSPAAVEASIRCLSAHDTSPGSVTFVLGDCTALTFEDASFDAVIDKATLDSLDCVGGSEAAISEAWRVLRPGGRLLCISCRDADKRIADLSPCFQLLQPRQDVWAEGRSAPCATYWIAALARRDVRA